jgi:predicted ArsR family transcriptional regulator
MVRPDRWTAVGALADSSRRALYDYIRRAGHPVGRDEAGTATGISRGLAAFHLDKLVEAGLLRARHEVPAGRPRGRGRAPKVYEPAGVGVAVAIPERRYELIAEILADAVATEPADAARAASRLAHQRGREVGARLPETGDDLAGALAALGFEPETEPDGTIALHNCPFHVLAVRRTELVCGLNHAFVAGILDGLGETRLQARTVRRPGSCCVRVGH